MAIRPVKEVPSPARFTRRESFVATDMREFVRKGMEVAVLEYDDHKPETVKLSVEKFIKSHPDVLRGVRTGVRQGKCYVWREVQR